MARGLYKHVYNLPIYSIQHNLVVDFLGDYSDLGKLNDICQQLGIEFDGWLPRAKGEYRKDIDLGITEKDKDEIYSYFHEEICLREKKF